MTRENAYAMHVDVADDYDFPGWTWGEVPENLVKEISVDAAKTVLDDFCSNAYLVIDEEDGRCSIRLQWGDDIGMWTPLSSLIMRWIDSRLAADSIHPEDAKPLVAAFEDALAKIKPLIRS